MAVVRLSPNCAMRLVGNGMNATDAEQRQVDQEEPLVHSDDELELAPVGEPVQADHREAQGEREVRGCLRDQGVADRSCRRVTGQGRHLQVEDEERDRDREHGVGEEDEALETEGGSPVAQAHRG